MEAITTLEGFEDELESGTRVEEISRGRYVASLPEEMLSEGPLFSVVLHAVESLIGHLPLGVCWVEGVEFPISQARKPNPGKSGLSRYLGLRGPGIAATIGKGVVLHPSAHARLFKDMCDVGLNLGFDPIHLNDNEASPYLDRAHQLAEMMEIVKEEDGRRVLYFMRLPPSREDLERAVSTGIRSFYAHACWDLDRLNVVGDLMEDVFLAIRGINCLSGSSVIGTKILYELLRFSGFDMIERPVALRREELELVRELDIIIGRGEAPAMPLTSPHAHQGVAIANVPEDLIVILNGDLGIYDHPGGIMEGVKSMKEVLDSFMRGENPLSIMRRDEGVGAMVKKWGYLLP